MPRAGAVRRLPEVRWTTRERGADAGGSDGTGERTAVATPTARTRFAKALQAWRRAAGYKQESLATALGLGNRSSISQWERGVTKPDLMILPELALALGVGFRTILEAWWERELPMIGSAEGRLLVARSRRLSPADRARLTPLIDVWIRPRDAVEAFAAEELRERIDALQARRQQLLNRPSGGDQAG